MNNKYKEVKILNYEIELIQYALKRLRNNIKDEFIIDVLDELILKLSI